MKVLRNQELETDNIQVGDQIVIQLEGFGKFAATAQKITDKGTVFLFDDCVAEQPMNKNWTNEGGYEKSDLCKWISTVLLEAFPEDIRTQISDLGIPSYGQMFGHDEWYDSVMEPDGDKQLPLMKKRKNRVADFEDTYEWYWLRNATKKEVSAANFAVVYDDGDAYSGSASNSRGVRPVFLLVS